MSSRISDRSSWWTDELIQEIPPRVFTTGTPACRGMDTSMFYHKNTLPALKVCIECPVRVECLQWALDNGDIHGVQGGITAADRIAYGYMTNARKMIAFSDRSRGF